MITIQYPEWAVEQEKIENIQLHKNQDRPGVYFIYGEQKELLYLGVSINPIKRVAQHIGSSHNNPLLHLRDEFRYFSLFHCECPAERDIYETHAINHLKPLYNIGKTFTYTHKRPEKPKDEKTLAIENMFQKQYEHTMSTFKL